MTNASAAQFDIEKSQKLLKEEPELVRRVKQEYPASYIGITPSSLSRIKKIYNYSEPTSKLKLSRCGLSAK